VKFTVGNDDRIFSGNSFVCHSLGEVNSQESRVAEVVVSTVWCFEEDLCDVSITTSIDGFKAIGNLRPVLSKLLSAKLSGYLFLAISLLLESKDEG